MRNNIEQIVDGISPLDEMEKVHILDTLMWIRRGEELFRIEKPDKPPKHLVSYFVLIDEAWGKIMLVDHIKAELWLPSGGHVELNEHPKYTVEREIMEELNMNAEFINEKPLFLTQTMTVGKTAGHMDVSLWYALKGDSEKEITYDKEEFNGYRWFNYDEILNMDPSKLDPHMKRFVRKMKSLCL